MSRKYLKAQPPSCTSKGKTEGDKIIWIDKDTPGGKICEDDQRSLSSDNYTYDYVPEAGLSAPADYGNSKAKLVLAYLYDQARKKEKPIGDFDTIASIIDTQYVQLTRYGRSRVDYCGAGANNTAPFAVGNTVVVAFEYQDVNRPVVVGFRHSPKSCEVYIRFKLNGFTPTQDGYKLKVTYGAGEDTEEIQFSVEGEYGLCGPFTCFGSYAYAYLYYKRDSDAFFAYYNDVGESGDWDFAGYLTEKVGVCGDVPDPNYVNAHYQSTPPADPGCTIFAQRVEYRKNSDNLAGIAPTVEDGRTIYDIDFSGIKIIKQTNIIRWSRIHEGIPDCAWCPPEAPLITYREYASGVLSNSCTGPFADSGLINYGGDPYWTRYNYDLYKGSFSVGSLVILTDQYGLNPAFTPSEYSVNAYYDAFSRNERTLVVVCNVSNVPIFEAQYKEYVMVTAPESELI